MSESVTSLRLKVDSTEVKNADKDLNNLSKTAGNTEKSAGTLSRSFLSLNKVLAGGAALGLAMQYVKLADTMTGVQSKLRLVTSSTQELTTAQEELFKIAQKTRQGYAETVETYSNFAVSMGEMGKSQKEILRVTETVNKAIAISGGTAQQAAAATMQLGQAFASGTLRGDELNSILENSKGLAQAIADGMGVPIGKLRTLGAEGKISAEVLATALEKSAQSVDEKFSKVGVTVGMSVTQIENALLDLVGTADQAMNGSGGISEVFSYFAEAMTNNKMEIIESGKDAFRALQVIGTGAIQAGAGMYTFMLSIPTALALAVDASSQLIENGVNNTISLAEDATNKIKSLYGGDRVKLGRVDIDTNLSGGLTKHYAGMVDLLNIASDTQAGLFKDIMANTTEIKKIAPPSDKAGTKKTGATEPTKEQIAAAKKAEAERLKAIKEEADIQKGYLDSYGDLQAQAAIENYNNEITYLNAYADMEAQAAIEQYNLDLFYIDDLAARQASAAISFYEMTRSEQDKINEDNLALYESNVGLFNDEQMQTFFTKWQESIEGVKGGYNDVQSIVSSFVEDSLNSKDWTVGLTGTAKSVANLGNAFKDLDKQNKKYETARKGIAKSNLNDEEKSIANKEIENAQFYAQIDAYGALAGAAAGFFEEGSKGAKAMQDISATLGIAQGIQAIIGAWGSAPFPLNMPAVAATTAAVLPMIGQLTSLGGSGGGGGGSVSAEQKFSNTAKYESEQANFIVDRLDRQIELLESIDSGGTAAKTKVSLAGSTFEADIAKLWADMIGTGERAFSILGNITTTGNSLSDVQTAIGWISGMKDVFRPEDWEWLDMTRGDILGFQSELESAVNSFALNLGDVKDTVKDSSQGFKEIYDSLSGTDFYKIRDLQNAYEELGNSIVGSSKDSMLSYISNAVSEMERLGSNYIETTKGILVGGTVNEQVLALKELSISFGHTFNNSTEEALNFLDSIELVAENMTAINDERQGLHDTYELLVGITTERENELKALDPSNRALQEHIWALEDLADNEIALTEARKASNESIKSFLTGLMDTSTSLDFTASRLGVNVASSVEELASLFIKLSTDTDGLKDSELQLLNANKSYLATQISNTDATKVATNALNNQKTSLNEYLNTITSGISTLEGALSSMVDVIDTLRGSAIGSSYTLGMYQKSMSETLALSGSSDYDKFNESLQKTIGYSSSLSDENNFALSRDMEFAQLVAANQFEGLKVKAFTQIDYLKLIEKNTRNQLDGLEKSITASSASTMSMLDILNAQLNELIGIKFMLKETWESQANGSLIWTSTGGATATQQQGATDYTIDTKTGTSFTGKEAISFVNSALASGDLMSIYTNAVKYGISSTSLDAMMGWASGTSLGWALNQGLPSFAVGTTNVTSDMLANIHKGEIITPAPFADGLRNGSLMMGNQNALIIELRNNNSLLSGIITKQDQQIQILLESRDIQNGSLVVLENIEGII